MNNQEKMIAHLNDLLTKNYDAEKGYKLATEKVESSQFKAFLEKRAQNRYDFGHDLKDEIRKLGGEPDKGSSMKGDLHRAWLGLKDALTSGDEAIFEECVRGEKAFVEEYEKVLEEKDTLPPSVITLVEKQLEKGKQALSSVKSLEDFAD